ncbi:hypothetical protein C8Q75DRAFT_811026 [Abortiporus biennis]|nr:hypothetical protein C8Q75DRAFT_811026 [Abortiporus biennis]
MASAIPVLPNPLTPLAWVPPDIAHQLQVVNFVLPAISGGWIADYLNSVYEEYVMLWKHKAGFPDVIYVLSRIVCCGFIATTLVFITGSNISVDCEKLNQATAWLGGFLLPLNSLLFFFRVKAVFFDSPIVVIVFALLWLATFAGISTPFLIHAIRVGPTSLCIDTTVKTSASSPFIVIAIHDTLVYLAITLRLIVINFRAGSPRWPHWKSFVRGDGMSNISQALLMSGQFYYLATIGVNISVAIAILIHSTPPFYQAMLTVMDAVFQNAMACRVHRQLKIGRILDVQESHGVLHHHQAPMPMDVGSIKFVRNVTAIFTRTGGTSSGSGSGDVQLDTVILDANRLGANRSGGTNSNSASDNTSRNPKDIGTMKAVYEV